MYKRQDLTSTEMIEPEAGSYTISGVLKNERDIDVYHASKSEENLRRIADYCDSTGLKINQKKTQLLAISSNRNRTKVWVQAGKDCIDSADKLKRLGFLFAEKPGVSRQIENLISRATRRMFVLRYYSQFMPGDNLRKLYAGLVRLVLEYNSVTYHSMLTKQQENNLETVQKKCI